MNHVVGKRLVLNNLRPTVPRGVILLEDCVFDRLLVTHRSPFASSIYWASSSINSMSIYYAGINATLHPLMFRA